MKTYIFDQISTEVLSCAKRELDVVAWDDCAIKKYEEAEAVIVRTFPMTEEVISKMPKLKIIAKHGVGVDNIDIAYAKSKGIIVTNTPQANMNSVAEMIIALMLDCVRKITMSHINVLRGLNKNSPLFLTGYELSGKIVGLIGLGKIGSLVGDKLQKAFDMKVLVYDPFASTACISERGFEKVDTIEELCKIADIFSVSVPLTEQTRNLLTIKELSLMKNTAIVINTSRGGIVNEKDIYQVLKEEKIYGAAFDVFESEPIAADHQLLTCNNFIATPHNGANTYDALVRMGMGAVEEIKRVKNGEKVLNPL